MGFITIYMISVRYLPTLAVTLPKGTPTVVGARSKSCRSNAEMIWYPTDREENRWLPVFPAGTILG
ncbi:hypothetical protein C5F59_038615 [Streptomyces sp. QL37]|uniref:hypothetical protein n=1 Tax=Streptomyces sp. QL37 TaxID=2093747 RepID=UPI0011B0A102|nr:hypothetical protein [Streptomyces sp. QL37]